MHESKGREKRDIVKCKGQENWYIMKGKGRVNRNINLIRESRIFKKRREKIWWDNGENCKEPGGGKCEIISINLLWGLESWSKLYKKLKFSR